MGDILCQIKVKLIPCFFEHAKERSGKKIIVAMCLTKHLVQRETKKCISEKYTQLLNAKVYSLFVLGSVFYLKKIQIFSPAIPPIFPINPI